MCKKSIQWKYVREKTDNDNCTSINTYLSVIFPNETFIYDQSIPKDVQILRNPDSSFRRYRPDARCEHLSLVIEIDGLPHYQNADTIITDYEKDAWFKALGYAVIRIPYWLQLTSEYVQYAFNQKIDKLSALMYSFYDVKLPQNLKNNPGILSCVGSMCELGRVRFVNEFKALPKSIQNTVMQDILTCRTQAESPELVAPQYVVDQLFQHLKDADFKFDDDGYKSATLLNIKEINRDS